MSEKKTPKSAKSSEAEAPSIEDAMERLEKLIEEMESGDLPLEKLITRYEEGVGLVRHCEKKLDAAGQKIQQITRSAAGPDGLQPFDPETDDS